VIRRKTWGGIGLLATLAVLSWLGARDRFEQPAKPFADLDTRLNYALWDLDARILDEKGRVDFEIDAPILRNNASSQIGTVESPRIRIQQKADEWYITADSAIITADREHVSLVGDVDMLRKKPSDRAMMKIRTRDVTLNVIPKTASTDAAVTITENNDRLKAVGMRLDLNSDSFELLHEVQAEYATP